MSIIKRIKKKVGDYLSDNKERKERSLKLKEIQDEFHLAKSSYDTTLMDEREKLYIGTHGVDANVNSMYSGTSGYKTSSEISKNRKLANNVINIIYEFIESQIDTTIPMPSVRSKYKRSEELAFSLQDSIKHVLEESEINRINDENERTTPVQGFSIIEVMWNPDYEHHLYRGEIQLGNKHPKLLIPQQGVFELQKMDYFFIISSVSYMYIKKRYNVDMKDEAEEYPEYNSIDGESDNNENTDNITLITKWFKDEDGDIGKITWANDTILEDLPKFFARRIDGKIEEYETIENDIVLKDGSIIPAMSPAIDEYGEPQIGEDGQPVMEPTRIKYFKPTRYPFVLRKNIPLPFNFGGQSDVDVIRDQADAIKKVVTIIEQKILKGGTILVALNDHKVDLTNELYKVIRGEANELAAIRSIDLQANVQQDIQFFQEQYKAAQNALGITDSFQGKPDPTAQSGVAKQIQVQQSSGRMQSKLFNKRNAYKELFEIIFEFQLAFYDETREYTYEGVDNTQEYGTFNKYYFLEKDITGTWYYNTDFIFSADAGDGIPKDKMWLMNQANIFVQQGLLNKVQFWAIMEKLGYPGASGIKKQAQEEIEMQQQQMQQQAQQQQQQNMEATQRQSEQEAYNREIQIAKLLK